ncbi:hypothetical protein PHPALM_31231 [Phytophthora palmivora]|uniref:Uncharacterized protein n=1 Tax=Phytophthora palmivora TaxID=4796 RepID=A0A2P4X358_9STRA|nr:hypothetical protein PHPALM_31231 [Phytophthora palmivora]
MLAIAATASSASEALPNHPSSSTSCIECTRLASAPTAHVIRPHADLASIRSAISETLTSLRTIEDTLSCESDFQQLQEEHEALQHTHVNARRHTHDLHRRLDQMMSKMEPFAHFCQDQYNQLTRDLELTNPFLVEKKPAVDELESDLSQLREAHDYLQKTSDASILHLQDESNVFRRQNDDLRSQLQAVTAHPDVGPAPPPALARRLRAQYHELAAVKQRCQVLEQSEESLASAVSQLRRQVEARDRRLARVREERDQFQAQLPGLQDERDRAIAVSTSALERLGKSRADLQAQGALVSSMRGTISRLEQKIANLQASQSQFQSDLASRNQELVTLRADHAAISSHYRDVYDRFRAVARLLNQDVALPTPSSLIRFRPEPTSPSGRAQKSSRINSPLASSSTPISGQISRSHDTITPMITPPSDLGSTIPLKCLPLSLRMIPSS